MAMTADGMAHALAEGIIATMNPAPSDADKAQIRKGCLGMAQALVTYLKANAVIRVSTTTSGLQRDPATSDPTLAPAADVLLPLE